MLQICYDSPSINRAQQQPPQIPDHLKCGEVYTWLCAGELYAVECKLCEDHPLCPLSEFPEHMDVWHTEWEENSIESYDTTNTNFLLSEEKIPIIKENEVDNHERSSGFSPKESGLFDTDVQLSKARSVTNQAEHEEILEPFEQVLIEQEQTIDTTIQTNEDVNEEECFKDVNELVTAEAGQYRIENQNQQKQTLAKQTLTVAYKKREKKGLNDITVEENEIRDSPARRESKRKFYSYPANNINIKQEFVNKRKRYKNKNLFELFNKNGNFRKNLPNLPEIKEIDSEASVNNNMESKKILRKYHTKRQNLKRKSSKLSEIKRALNKIIKDISVLKESDETESETSVDTNILNENPRKNPETAAQTSRNGTNVLNKIRKSQIARKINKNKKHRKTMLFKTNKSSLDNFKKSKRIFRQRNQNKIENKSELEPRPKRSLENKINYKTVMEDNELKITEINPGIPEIETNLNKNETDRRKHKKNLLKNLNKLRNHKTMKKESDLQAFQKCTNKDKSETSFKNESNFNKNKIKLNKNIKEINKSIKEQNGIETKLYFRTTKESKNRDGSVKSQNNSKEQMKYVPNEENKYNKGTNGSETNIFIMKSYNNKLDNELNSSNSNPKETSGNEIVNSNLVQKTLDFKANPERRLTRTQAKNLLDNKNKTQRNKIKGTNENETMDSNPNKYTQQVLELNAKRNGYLTRKRARDSKDNRNETNGNETLSKQNSSNQHLLLKDNSELLTRGVKDQLETHKIETCGNETIIPKCERVSKRKMSQNSSKNITKSFESETLQDNNQQKICLDKKEKIKIGQYENINKPNKKETGGNKTRSKTMSQYFRKSCRMKSEEESLLQKYSTTQHYSKGTSEIETFLNDNVSQESENEKGANERETLIEENHTNQIDYTKLVEDDNRAGTNKIETLQSDKEFSELTNGNASNSENVMEFFRVSQKIRKPEEKYLKKSTRKQFKENEQIINETETLMSVNSPLLEVNVKESKESNGRWTLPNKIDMVFVSKYKRRRKIRKCLQKSKKVQTEAEKCLEGHQNNDCLKFIKEQCGSEVEETQNVIRKSLRNMRKSSKCNEISWLGNENNIESRGMHGIETQKLKEESNDEQKPISNMKDKRYILQQDAKSSKIGESQDKSETENPAKILGKSVEDFKSLELQTDGNFRELKSAEIKNVENVQEVERNSFKNSEPEPKDNIKSSATKLKCFKNLRRAKLSKEMQLRRNLKTRLRTYETPSIYGQTSSVHFKSYPKFNPNFKKGQHLLKSRRRRIVYKARKEKALLSDFLDNSGVKNFCKNSDFPQLIEKTEMKQKPKSNKISVRNENSKVYGGELKNSARESCREKDSKQAEAKSDIKEMKNQENENREAYNWPEITEPTLGESNDIENIIKLALDTQLFSSKTHQEGNTFESVIRREELSDEAICCSNASSSNSFTQNSSPTITTEALSPQTEEEHFEFHEPKEKLNRQHISRLIQLFQEHPRLWDQTHPDFCEPHICRKSWQQITEKWNKFCERKFSIAEVRIRLSTLCQRFVQERDRLALEGEVDELAKFPYYEQLKYLEHQNSLRKRSELYDQQNAKILEIYQHFPILWHVRYYKSRQAKKRAAAFECISKVLKLFGLHLSSIGVQKRIRSLRKCYRLEKIRYLHARVEQIAFAAQFRHYETMQFLDKHIDPFVCDICGKIFEHLQGFREHLDAENHGSILPQDEDTENSSNENIEVEEIIEPESTVEFSPASSQMECFTESENSTDILQRFTPISSTPIPFIENPLTVLESNCSQESLTLNVANEPLINSLHFENHIIEEIMENVASNDSFNQQSLDQFINSVTSCDELTKESSIFEEVLSPSLLHMENSFIIQHPDVISDAVSPILSPLTNAESLISVNFDSENSLILKPSDATPDLNSSIPTVEQEDIIIQTDSISTKQIDEQSNVDAASPENLVTAEIIGGKPSPSSALVVKVQFADVSMDLKLNDKMSSSLKPTVPDTDNECCSSGDNSTSPLPDILIHKMIELYRKYPQLWNPNHLDYSSRTLRRQAWVNLTMEFNTKAGKQLSWRTLHRKLTDYTKYYKKLLTEQENYEKLENKWTFYEDFKFMDDVFAVNTELQRSVHHRDNNFKIISTYKTFPQLWDIKHPDFGKRSCKRRYIELICNRLQEENNLQLTTERLKSRLIELRAHYRSAKKQRLKCLKNQQPFSSYEFEYYEALSFLDNHIDPFNCDKCKMEFKRLTDFNKHVKKEHSQNKHLISSSAKSVTENVCHICGMKCTTRSNLAHHIKRHEGIQNYSCTMCPKKFFASHALKIHVRSHTKECPYTCEKCGASFVSASKLNQHVKRHLNQKNFECSYCPKTFFTAFEKDRHERRHLNIRDKVCPICGKTFVAGSSYYAHLMLHNDTKRFECDKCDKKFAQYPGLFKHKKRYHM